MLAVKIGEKDAAIAVIEAKLGEAQKAHAEMLRKERALDDARRELDLTIEKRVAENLSIAREQARIEAEEKLSLKVYSYSLCRKHQNEAKLRK